MRDHASTAAIGVLFVLACGAAHASPSGPVFPGNEAVRIIEGKRVVEAPPLTAATQRYLKAGLKLAPPRPGSEVYMIEGPDELMDCTSIYFSKTGCVPSSIGTNKRSRFWTVKLNGVWMHCDSRAAIRKCEPAAVGVPGGMSTVE